MNTYYNEDTIIYKDGEYLKASEAKTDFYGHSLHYGYGVFEGIRSYKTDSGDTRIFKATEHFKRLKNSASGGSRGERADARHRGLRRTVSSRKAPTR